MQIVLLLMVPALPLGILAGNPEKPSEEKASAKAAPPTVEERLLAQQERLQKLENMVAQQTALLQELRQQLALKVEGVEEAGSPAATATVLAGEEPQSSGPVESAVAAAPVPATITPGSDIPKQGTAAGNPLTAGWDGSHLSVRSADNQFTMRFGGRMQMDYRGYQGSATPVNSFFLRRARLEVRGQLFDHYDYKVQADFATTGGKLLRDAYININYVPAFQVTLGQFKIPFNQEGYLSSKYIEFVEHSSANNITHGRGIGFMVHSGEPDQKFEYSVGVYNGLDVLEPATHPQPEIVGQIHVAPFRNGGAGLWENFVVGGGISNGRNANGMSYNGRTASQSVSFFTPVPVNGSVQRYNTEFAWYFKSASLRGEYNQSNQFREGLGVGGTDLPGVTGKAYSLIGTYLLTGEKKGEGVVVPRESFLNDNHGRGAWELAVRYENLQLDDKVNGNRGEAYTFGVNWWMTRFVKHQSNFVFERFKDPLRAAEPGSRNHVGFLSRIQVIF